MKKQAGECSLRLSSLGAQEGSRGYNPERERGKDCMGSETL